MKTFINKSQITFQQIITTIHKNINKNNNFQPNFIKVNKTKSIKQLLHIYKAEHKLFNKNLITELEIIEKVCEDYNRGLN